MRAKKVRRLLKELPEVNSLGDKLVIDVAPIYTKVAKKRRAKSRHVLAFTLLNQTFTEEMKADLVRTIGVHFDDRATYLIQPGDSSEDIVILDVLVEGGAGHLVDFDDNNEVFVTIFGVDYPMVDELDIRIGAAIGFALGYCPEDVVLHIEDGAGQKGTTDVENDVVGTKVLTQIGDLYEMLLADDERESIPAPALAAVA